MHNGRLGAYPKRSRAEECRSGAVRFALAANLPLPVRENLVSSCPQGHPRNAFRGLPQIFHENNPRALGQASIAGLIQYISVDYHLSNISRGVIDSRNIIYFASLIGFFLFTTIRVLEIRKWR